MTEALTLFGFDSPKARTDTPRARNRDPKSSHDAARRVRVGQYDPGIFDLLERYRALTKNQICAHLGLKEPREWGTVSSRLSQLRAAGKLEWAGLAKGDGNIYRIASQTVETNGRV